MNKVASEDSKTRSKNLEPEELNEKELAFLSKIRKPADQKSLHKDAYTRFQETIRKPGFFANVSEDDEFSLEDSNFDRQLQRDVSRRLEHAKYLFTAAESELQNASYSSYEKAVKLYTKSARCLRTIDAYLRRGQCYAYMSKFKLAESSFLIALELASEEEDIEYRAFCYENIGRIRYYHGDMHKALQFLQLAEPIFQGLGNTLYYAYVHNTIGRVYFHLGWRDTALDYNRQAHDLFAQLKNDDGQAQALNYMSRIYSEKGEYVDAFLCSEKALEVFIRNNNSLRIAQTYNTRGRIYEKQEKYNDALNEYRKALNIFGRRQLGNMPGLTRVYNDLGRIYTVRKNYKRALFLHKHAMSLAENVQDDLHRSHIYRDMGHTHLQQATAFVNTNKYQEAEKKYNDAETCFWSSMSILSNPPINNDFYMAEAFENLRKIHVIQAEIYRKEAEITTERATQPPRRRLKVADDTMADG